jgi:hypothetical protein
MRFAIPKVAAMAKRRSTSIATATAVVRERGDSR